MMLDNSLAQLDYEHQHNSLAQLEDSRLESEQKQVLTTEMYLNDSIPLDDMINDSRHLDSRIEEDPPIVQDSYGVGTPMNESPMEHGSIGQDEDAGSIKLSEDGWGQEEQFNKTTDLKEVREISHQAEGENEGFEIDFEQPKGEELDFFAMNATI
jgi:hypothetical protein